MFDVGNAGEDDGLKRRSSRIVFVCKVLQAQLGKKVQKHLVVGGVVRLVYDKDDGLVATTVPQRECREERCELELDCGHGG